MSPNRSPSGFSHNNHSDLPSTSLKYTITHVFLPAKSKGYRFSDDAVESDRCLARAWCHITRMLDNLLASVQSQRPDKLHVISQLRRMHTGDILACFNRTQGAAVIFRKQDCYTSCEAFQTSWDSTSKLEGLYEYPEWAVKIPSGIFQNQYFQSELANFLLYLDDISETHTLSEDCATYTTLLASILRSVGCSTEVPRIIKRVHTHCTFGSRSPLWLLIKIAIQTSLNHDGSGHFCYKVFMLHFMCNLAGDAIAANLSGDVLHAISAKILRRLRKLGSSSPSWLYDKVLMTSASLREALEVKWKEVEITRPPPSLWDPSQLDLAEDTRLSFLGSLAYIRSSLMKLDPNPRDTPFCPKHLPRGTLGDLLSSNGSFFEATYRADPHVALHDVEHAIEKEIDDWITGVTDVDQACFQLEIFLDIYLSNASHTYRDNPEHLSVMLLAAIELWVALDKLVIIAVPMLADYSPEVPIELLQRPLFRKSIKFHRLFCAYRYLSARWSRFLPGQSIFSEEFTKNMLRVRYHVNFPDSANSADLRPHLEGYRSTSPPDVEVGVFELRCPVSLHIWRSATACFLASFPYHPSVGCYVREDFLPSVDIPRMQPFIVESWTSRVTDRIYFTCIAPNGLRPWNILCNISKDYRTGAGDEHFAYRLLSGCELHEYIDTTSHTSNQVLAAQARCPTDLSLHEFVAFGHLRSGASLQWVNILRELRSRTLNFRRHDVHLLLAQTISQVGPLDPNTAELVWHRDLQEPSFCHALLGELESLLLDVGAHSSDGVMMASISFVLTRLLATPYCSEDISGRAVGLLRRVRAKTFEWVGELSYDLMTAPMNAERSGLLRDMAASCRSTFDVDSAILHKVLYSAEDVEALLSCAIFIHANSSVDSELVPGYSRLLLERDRRLSHVLESPLRDIVRADPSDRGIDLAIHKVWSGYCSGPHRWRPLSHPNSHWLACETAATGGGHSQLVHLNLLDGTLLVDGSPIAGLPSEIRGQPTYKRIFGDQAFLSIASNLPGMDLCTLAVISEHRIHFALRGDKLVIRAQHKNTADIFQVIPQEKLQGDLPTTLLHGHVHWLNLSTSIIEIRPLEKLWEQSLDNWKIDCTSGKYRMYKGRECLVDIRSPTWTMVSNRLDCLDDPANLIVTTSPIDTSQSSPTRRLSVTLPRYALSFFVSDDGNLESRDFKDMVYDENQYIGTLFGLENRLVLRPNVRIEEGLVHKCVIIPDGNISHERQGHHVHVKIDTRKPCMTGISHLEDDTTKPVIYHTYRVDTDLGCLTGCASWRDKLYIVHLHAQTSIDWRPDPLTGRTGIQEALRLLRSAGCRSVMELDARYEEPDLLSPTNYQMYPQIVFAFQEIKYLIDRQRFLYSTLNGDSDLPPRPQLNVTDALRTAYLFPLEIAGSIPVPAGIRRSKYSEREDNAYIVSLAVYYWLADMENGMELTRDDNESGDILNWVSTWANPSLLPRSIAEVDALLYEAKERPTKNWWDRKIPSPSIAEVDVALWCATEARQRFRLLFLLPIIVYRQGDPQPAFRSILAALAKRILLENLSRCGESRSLGGPHSFPEALRNCFVNARRAPIPRRNRDTRVDWLSKETPLVIADRYDMERLSIELQTCFRNCFPSLNRKEDLTRRFSELESVLNTCPDPGHPPRSSFSALEDYCYTPGQITLSQLLDDRCAPKLPARSCLRSCGPEGNAVSSNSSADMLNRFFASLQTNQNASFQQQYVSRLYASARHIRREACPTSATGRPTVEELQNHFMQCKVNYTTALSILKDKLGPMVDPLGQAIEQSGQWPQITPDSLFRCLASTSPIKLPTEWKKCVESLALLLLELQRARRLLRYSLDHLEDELLKELQNKGCDGWSVEEHPDWLLIQLQGDFLTRTIQADAAMKIISPPSGENTTIQVNMGEGKSSVILPISAATLADGNQLVRVIVPKALTVQMFRLLVDRLGGIVNRPVYHLSFSRSLTGGYCQQRFEHLEELLAECMRNRGILVVQPEHILSLKLTSIQLQLPQDSDSYDHGSDSDTSWDWIDKVPSMQESAPSRASLELQKWLHSHVRDIVDESDEVFHPRFQLMYTIGLQRHMQGYPNRWTITQQVLRLVRKHTPPLAHDLPDDIEYELGPSGLFPRIRILRASDAHQRLISLIVDDVMDGYLPGFSFRDIDRDRRLRAAIRAFISSKDVFEPTARMVEEYARKTMLLDGILLLRGLLACNVLLFALAERRWRVDYGLFPKRTMLAVPYRAKDVPAPAAEFGHPDITIVLTCLSYYYGGLTEEQLRASFEILQEQDDPSTEYANWLRDYDPDSLPESIRDLRNVNTKSSEQWDRHLFPLFARNQGAVDLYLSQVVFPKEAKEFPWKLAASSWDLAEIRERPITGFSGTNDCQDLLPITITQCDLDHQRGTNARVLSYLLQPENSAYALIPHLNGKRHTTLEFLKTIVQQDPEIRVLLDVGAQILEFSNYQVAKAWLELSSDADGGVYFNEDDELMVLTKDGARRSLLSSPLAQQLDRCVVYLDDAHTRGTDLKFPTGLRAAVTLGPKVTKDRLVQGCMRMRKLGHGHSVMFFAPLEVDWSIRDLAGKQDMNVSVITSDILRWAIHETWTDIRERAPYWAQQGINHRSRYDAWTRFCSNKLRREHLADTWLQPEHKSLADLYAPFQTDHTESQLSTMDDHPDIQQHCIDLGVVKLPQIQMEEEQEREVNREIEREREVKQCLPRANPAKHSLHPDLVAFVKTGVIPPTYTNRAFRPISSILDGTSMDTSNAHFGSPFLLATADFCKTIEPSSRLGRRDEYLRPIQWVLSGKRDTHRVLILLSPFEADGLMPEIRASERVHLHVYTPRTSERLRPADDLMFYSIPPVPDGWQPPWGLIDQLNIFAGQLYLRDYASYLRLSRLLGIQIKDQPRNVGTAVRNLVTAGMPQVAENTYSPLPFVMKLLAIRQRGKPFSETHMGRILQGQVLTEKDFDTVGNPVDKW